MFEVKLHPKVGKFLKKCETELAERIKAKLRLLKEDPFFYLEHYEGDFYKLRVGDYRALIDYTIPVEEDYFVTTQREENIAVFLFVYDHNCLV